MKICFKHIIKGEKLDKIEYIFYDSTYMKPKDKKNSSVKSKSKMACLG